MFVLLCRIPIKDIDHVEGLCLINDIKKVLKKHDGFILESDLVCKDDRYNLLERELVFKCVNESLPMFERYSYLSLQDDINLVINEYKKKTRKKFKNFEMKVIDYNYYHNLN